MAKPQATTNNMFNRKSHIETLKMAFPDWPIERIGAEADREEKRHAKVKIGDNVLHINHSGTLLSDQDFQSIEKNLNTVNYELSRYETSGHMMASAEDFITGITLYLNQVTVQETIGLGMATNALWDVIKMTIASIYHIIRNKTIHIISSRIATEKNVIFNIALNYDKSIQLKFVIENIPENKIQIAIDQIKLVKKPEWVESKIPQVAVYNPEENTWNIVDYDSKMLQNRVRIIRTLPLDDYIKEVASHEKNKVSR